MSSLVGIYFILLVNNVVLNIAFSVVEFDAPKQIKKNELYKLVIRNPSPGLKFPVEDFAFSFELIKGDPRLVLSVAEITSLTYTGDEYRGFTIKDFAIKNDLIEMLIEFRSEAHGTKFRIRYASAKTENDKVAFYDLKSNIGVIMERDIDMLLPYTITLQIGPEIREVIASDRDAVGHVLLPDKNGQISCQATDGLPNAFPTFENSHLLVGANVNAVNNDITKLIWMVRQQDHGKQIQCRAGQQIKNITLNVYHYMTGVLTYPDVTIYAKQGSEIMCFSKDGFPIAKTQWNFLSGPKDSNKYYQLSNNKTILMINSTAPLNSNWTFECQGSNYIPPIVAKYMMPSPNYPIKQTYNFTIVDPGCIDLRASVNVGAIVAIILVLTIIIAVSIVGFKHKVKILKFINSKRMGTGQLSKNPQKSAAPGYKYSDIGKGEVHRNGTDKDQEATYYSEIVATVQPKTSNPLGPIDRV